MKKIGPEVLLLITNKLEKSKVYIIYKNKIHRKSKCMYSLASANHIFTKASNHFHDPTRFMEFGI